MTGLTSDRLLRFEQPDLKVIVRSQMTECVLDICTVARHAVRVLFIDGQFIETLPPGLYAFWKGQSDSRLINLL